MDDEISWEGKNVVIVVYQRHFLRSLLVMLLMKMFASGTDAVLPAVRLEEQRRLKPVILDSLKMKKRLSARTSSATAKNQRA